MWNDFTMASTIIAIISTVIIIVCAILEVTHYFIKHDERRWFKTGYICLKYVLVCGFIVGMRFVFIALN